MKKSTIIRLILPSIICMLGIIIITLVSAFMYYFGDGPRKLGDFLIVFSPTIILLIFLFVAWRWQFIGGTIMIIVGLALIIGILFYQHDSKYLMGVLEIAFLTGIPIILSGILFRKIHSQKKS